MFRHIRENKYMVNQNYIPAVCTTLDEMMGAISDKSIKYNGAINNELFKTLLSRYISNKFILDHKDVFDKGVPHVIISIDIYELDLMITISNLGEDGYAHGCMENR